MDFDTGSPDIFIAGPRCRPHEGYMGKKKSDQEGKVDHNTETLHYGSATVEGTTWIDEFTIAGLTVKRQGFVAVSKADGFIYGIDGLVGMALSKHGKTNYTSLFAQLDRTGPGSYFTLGGRKHAKFTGEVTRVNVTGQGYWQIRLDAIDVNGDSIEGTIGEAIIDTGSTMVTAPTAVAAAIFARIPHAVMYSRQKLADGDTTQDYAYPCETPAEYVPALRFADKQFPIDPENFNAGVLVDMPQSTCGGPLPIGRLTKRSTMCMAALQGVDISMPDTKHPYRLTKGYIVGDAFLKNWYSILNYGDYLDEGREGGVPASVSFAKAI